LPKEQHSIRGSELAEHRKGRDHGRFSGAGRSRQDPTCRPEPGRSWPRALTGPVTRALHGFPGRGSRARLAAVEGEPL